MSNENQLAKGAGSVRDAWNDDPEFRARMERDPKGALESMGVALPFDEVRLAVNTADVVHVVLPPDPNAKLRDEQLDAVSGGSRHCADCWTPPPLWRASGCI